MKTLVIINKKGQTITIRAESEEDIPVAFCIGGNEPSDVVHTVDVDSIPEIDEDTEEITIKKEDLIDIPEGIEMMHKFDKPIKVNIE